jgi:Sec-independent protein translocase protein TatA
LFGIGAQEALLVGILAIVFGPGKLTEATREYGTVLGKARK